MSSYAKARTDDYEDRYKKTKCQSFMSSIYNKRKGTCLGRTPKSWCLILIFYLIYYACLSGFFLGMMSVFLYNFIPVSEPMRTGKNSLLGFTPGVNVNPRSTNEIALINASSKVGSEYYKKYLELVDNFFAKSFVDQTSSKGVNCTNSSNEPKDVERFCIFDKTQLGPCASPKDELTANRLCSYMRINKIYGWLPMIKNQSISNDILLECGGQNPGDINNLGKPVYFPNITVGSNTFGLFSNIYYPFVRQANYTPPMVALQFPNMIRNLAILVQCSLQNIENVYKPVRFEIMLSEK